MEPLKCGEKIQYTSLCRCRFTQNILAGATDFDVSFGSLAPLRFLGHSIKP